MVCFGHMVHVILLAKITCPNLKCKITMLCIGHDIHLLLFVGGGGFVILCALVL